ncbi:MAG TPA: hypothetical protein VGF42_03365 [Caulobacteraceae bacterium]
MPEANDALLVDLLTWLAGGDRPYGEVMEAWRSSCPRLTIWEDALVEGWIKRRSGANGALVAITDEGRAWLTEQQARAA